MPFQKGKSGNPNGRKKGIPNKATVVMKQAVMNAYAGIGGDRAFAKWARANPTDFYRIAARLIPQEITAPAGMFSVHIHSDEKQG